MNSEELKSKIRSISDFPQKGIIFRDITTLVKDPDAFRYVIDHLYERYKDKSSMPSSALNRADLYFAAPWPIA
jgi:adenine phosphoribosyltransferase